MQYLLDSNVLITANALYYETGRIPQFWDWISDKAKNGAIKVPDEILREITPSDNDQAFKSWMTENSSKLKLVEESNNLDVFQVLSKGYGFDPDTLREGVSVENTNDAILVAYAFSANGSRCIVTLEAEQTVHGPLPSPANRKIPLVCDLLGVPHINTFDLIRKLDFRIPKQ